MLNNIRISTNRIIMVNGNIKPIMAVGNILIGLLKVLLPKFL